MKEINEIKQIIDEISQEDIKEYDKMEIEQISSELKNVMACEQKYYRKIEELEKKKINQELLNYAKMICKNTVERKILDIQKIYLEKIDEKYVNLKK